MFWQCVCNVITSSFGFVAFCCPGWIWKQKQELFSFLDFVPQRITEIIIHIYIESQHCVPFWLRHLIDSIRSLIYISIYIYIRMKCSKCQLRGTIEYSFDVNVRDCGDWMSTRSSIFEENGRLLMIFVIDIVVINWNSYKTCHLSAL